MLHGNTQYTLLGCFSRSNFIGLYRISNLNQIPRLQDISDKPKHFNSTFLRSSFWIWQPEVQSSFWRMSIKVITFLFSIHFPWKIYFPFGFNALITVTVKQHQPVAFLNCLENNNNHAGLKGGRTEDLLIKRNKIWW